MQVADRGRAHWWQHTRPEPRAHLPGGGGGAGHALQVVGLEDAHIPEEGYRRAGSKMAVTSGPRQCSSWGQGMPGRLAKAAGAGIKPACH